MKFSVSLHRGARKFLERIPRRERERIVRGLKALEADPFTARSGSDIRRLQGIRGRQDLYRLRIGKYRAVYAVDGREVLVTDIWERGHGYDI